MNEAKTRDGYTIDDATLSTEEQAALVESGKEIDAMVARYREEQARGVAKPEDDAKRIRPPIPREGDPRRQMPAPPRRSSRFDFRRKQPS